MFSFAKNNVYPLNDKLHSHLSKKKKKSSNDLSFKPLRLWISLFKLAFSLLPTKKQVEHIKENVSYFYHLSYCLGVF